MKVLLITTSVNAVRTTLERKADIELLTIDCATLQKDIMEEFEQLFQDVIPELLIIYRCPYIIPKHIFSRVRLGAFNIHPSLLPKYPGKNPWNDIFRNHEREGGVTLHRMTEHIDAGPIIFQASFLITESDTIDSARLKADEYAALLVQKLIKNLTT